MSGTVLARLEADYHTYAAATVEVREHLQEDQHPRPASGFMWEETLPLSNSFSLWSLGQVPCVPWQQ